MTDGKPVRKRECKRCGKKFLPAGTASWHCSVACRFWTKVAIDLSTGCWVWGGASAHGYGRITVSDKSCLVHRWAYEQFVEPIPLGLSVRHKCDNPICCNPVHLLVGTLLDNNKDRDSRGRTARGEAHGSVKLTARKVREIKRRALVGELQKSIAADYGVTAETVSNIKTGHTWGHVE